MPGEGELGTASTMQFPACLPAAGREALQAQPGQGSGDGMSQGQSGIPGLHCLAAVG